MAGNNALHLSINITGAERIDDIKDDINRLDGRKVNIKFVTNANAIRGQLIGIQSEIKKIESSAKNINFKSLQTGLKDANKTAEKLTSNKGGGKGGSSKSSSIVAAVAGDKKSINDDAKAVQKAFADLQKARSRVEAGARQANRFLNTRDNSYLLDNNSSTTLAALENEISQAEVLTKRADSIISRGAENLKASEVKNMNALTSEMNANKNRINAYKDNARDMVDVITNVNRNLSNIDKVGNRYSSWYNNYRSSIEGNFEINQKANDFYHKLSNNQFGSVTDAQAAFAKLRTEARLAGVEVQSFGQRFEQAFGIRIQSLAMTQGIFMLTGALRDLVAESISVDTAMTELKKVTDETDATYAKFLSDASSRAQTIGATLSEVVNATADYARLGYNINDATQLANSALIYENVGDGIESIDDATSALISTMQGFGIAASDSMSIVDKFNNVSNNFASSAGDIGEITKRSAASMAAAGNDLDQTIALGVAANEVQQDA